MADAGPPLKLLLLICFMLCCTSLVEADERPASVTDSSSSGNQSWGYVEVRKKAHIFWFYHRSPHRVSSAEKPWPTLLYAAPASSKHIRLEGLEHIKVVRTGNDESRWLHYADIIFVDTPVGTGFSYYDEDASPDMKKKFSSTQMGADVVELLKDLAVQIPTLKSSPLILLGKSYAGDQVGQVAGSVVEAIHECKLNLRVGGIVFGYHGRATIMPFEYSAEDSPSCMERDQ